MRLKEHLKLCVVNWPFFYRQLKSTKILFYPVIEASSSLRSCNWSIARVTSTPLCNLSENMWFYTRLLPSKKAKRYKWNDKINFEVLQANNLKFFRSWFLIIRGWLFRRRRGSLKRRQNAPAKRVREIGPRLICLKVINVRWVTLKYSFSLRYKIYNHVKYPFQEKAKSPQSRVKVDKVLQPLPALFTEICERNEEIKDYEKTLNILKEMTKVVYEEVELPCLEQGLLLKALAHFYHNSGATSKLRCRFFQMANSDNFDSIFNFLKNSYGSYFLWRIIISVVIII